MNTVGLPPFPDYELIDSGHHQKLERFGPYILARPEPQALWPPALEPAAWTSQAHAVFTRKNNANDQGDDGNWTQQAGMPDQWFIAYQHGPMALRFRLGLTAFKHVGLFPEQADNWNYIYAACQRWSDRAVPRVLNLFAYTGAASLAAKAGGADVIHVDSVKPVVTWARQNMEASGLDHIRWVVEDALKFVQKEAKRGRQYQGIILDPPAYGRGPDGERWLLDRHLGTLLEACATILDPQAHFLVLNLYSMGFSGLVAENLVQAYCPWAQNLETGELFVADRRGAKLPLGVFARFQHG